VSASPGTIATNESSAKARMTLMGIIRLTHCIFTNNRYSSSLTVTTPFGASANPTSFVKTKEKESSSKSHSSCSFNMSPYSELDLMKTSLSADCVPH
jgi:hypothetical protein